MVEHIPPMNKKLEIQKNTARVWRRLSNGIKSGANSMPNNLKDFDVFIFFATDYILFKFDFFWSFHLQCRRRNIE